MQPPLQAQSLCKTPRHPSCSCKGWACLNGSGRRRAVLEAGDALQLVVGQLDFELEVPRHVVGRLHSQQTLHIMAMCKTSKTAPAAQHLELKYSSKSLLLDRCTALHHETHAAGAAGIGVQSTSPTADCMHLSGNDMSVQQACRQHPSTAR